MSKPRSASADKICTVAVAHFSEHGYDASSLNDIATEAGMRKASLYSHFTGKDSLFLAVLDDALQQEADFIAACFDAEADAATSAAGAATAGALYCERMAARYAASPYLRFLLRTAYLPPPALREHIGSSYEAVLAQLHARYLASLAQRAPALTSTQRALYGDAYLGIVDSLHVELIYANGAALQRRHAALWRILADSLEKAPTIDQ